MISDTKADTREKLIIVAIKLFAQQGFSGVSMRTINSAAGTKNSSAVHYHFGSKMGIIEAIMDKLDSQLAPIYDQVTHDLENRLEEGKLTTEDVVMAIQLPFWALYCTPEYGRYAVKLCARLMLEADDDLKQLYNRYLTGPIGRMFDLMRKLQPEKAEQQLRFQLSLCLMSMISGISSIDLMDQTPLGDIRFSDDPTMMLSYIYYVANGLDCETPDYSRLDMSFWAKYSQYLQSAPQELESKQDAPSEAQPESSLALA